MSYSRWSSNDFQCDVYVYEAEEGFVIHVASNRITWLVDLPPHYEWEEGGFDFDQWYARSRIMSDLIDDETTHTRAPIGLPHDGETFSYIETPGECATQLVELRDMGYQVPDSVIKDLQEEETEETEQVIDSTWDRGNDDEH